KPMRCGDVQRLGEAARIGDDVNELGQHLWCYGNEVAGGQQPCERVSCGDMLGMLQHFRGHQKPCVKSVNHERPSSISPSRSSSAGRGLRTRPKLTGGMSAMLCACDAVIGGASTVTSCPSGRRTPSVNTTTPFCT